MPQKVSDQSAQTPIIVKNDASSQNADKPATPPEDSTEYCVVFLGSAHKQKLFDKLLAASQHFERHIQYKDTYYLYFTINGENFTIELTDPGLAHTGAREMAIRKADAVILCYAAYDAESFHRLASISSDFECRKKDAANFPPILLICDEDESAVTNSGENTARSSTSEGYESAGELNSPPPALPPSGGGRPAYDNTTNQPTTTKLRHRRPSMEKLELCDANFQIVSAEQGRDMADLYKPHCEFVSISVANYDETPRLIENLLLKIKEKQQPSRKTSGGWKKGARNEIKNAITQHLQRRRSLAATATSAAASVGAGTPNSTNVHLVQASLNVETTSASSSSLSSSASSTNHHYLSLNKINPFSAEFSAPFHISPIFKRRKSKSFSKEKATKEKEKEIDEINEDEQLSPIVTDKHGVTQIQIYGDELALPRNYRSRSVHALTAHEIENAKKCLEQNKAKCDENATSTKMLRKSEEEDLSGRLAKSSNKLRAVQAHSMPVSPMNSYARTPEEKCATASELNAALRSGTPMILIGDKSSHENERNEKISFSSPPTRPPSLPTGRRSSEHLSQAISNVKRPSNLPLNLERNSEQNENESGRLAALASNSNCESLIHLCNNKNNIGDLPSPSQTQSEPHLSPRTPSRKPQKAPSTVCTIS